jgi:HSP20 family molecular chaperone IbpA
VFTPWTTKIQDDGSLLLKLDLPGVLDTDLSIETFEKTLEIKVFSKRFDNENQDIHTQVINTTMYDLEKIEATFKHCVLELVIPVKVERKSIVKITFKK